MQAHVAHGLNPFFQTPDERSSPVDRRRPNQRRRQHRTGHHTIGTPEHHIGGHVMMNERNSGHKSLQKPLATPSNRKPRRLATQGGQATMRPTRSKNAGDLALGVKSTGTQRRRKLPGAFESWIRLNCKITAEGDDEWPTADNRSPPVLCEC